MTGTDLGLEVLVRRQGQQTDATARDLAKSGPVACRVTVGARVGPIEDALQQRTVDEGLATRALVGAQGLGQRTEASVVIAVDAPGFGQQPDLGGVRVPELQQQRGCGRQVVVPERELLGMDDSFGTQDRPRSTFPPS